MVLTFGAQMDGNLREIVGFLCRWSLLGAVFLAALATAALAFGATAGVHEALTVQMALPDSLHTSRRKAHVVGYLDSRFYDRMSLVLFAVPDSGRVSRASPYGGRFSLAMDDPPPPGVAVEMTGMPYGPFAFRKLQAQMFVLDRAKRLLLIDGRLGRGDSQGLATAADMDRLARFGQAAFFLDSPIGDFERSRRLLVRRFGHVPVLLATASRRGNLPMLEWIVRRLHLEGMPQVAVVTADRSFVRVAAAGLSRWATVHLLSESDLVEGVDPGLKVHKSWTGLMDALLPTGRSGGSSSEAAGPAALEQQDRADGQ